MNTLPASQPPIVFTQTRTHKHGRVQISRCSRTHACTPALYASEIALRGSQPPRHPANEPASQRAAEQANEVESGRDTWM